MCEFVVGTLHACGHPRTRTLVERCQAAQQKRNSCPRPETIKMDSYCHACGGMRTRGESLGERPQWWPASIPWGRPKARGSSSGSEYEAEQQKS